MAYWYSFPAAVSEASVGQLISWLLDLMNSEPNPVATIFISSPGGDLDSAIRFYDFVKATNIKLNIYGYGQVDSAAIMIFLCGQERTLISNCRLRLHAPHFWAIEGRQHLNVHAEQMENLRVLNERYFEILENELPQVKDLRKIIDNGKIIDVDEAIRLGIATKKSDKIPVINQAINNLS